MRGRSPHEEDEEQAKPTGPGCKRKWIGQIAAGGRGRQLLSTRSKRGGSGGGPCQASLGGGVAVIGRVGEVVCVPGPHQGSSRLPCVSAATAEGAVCGVRPFHSSCVVVRVLPPTPCCLPCPLTPKSLLSPAPSSRHLRRPQASTSVRELQLQLGDGWRHPIPPSTVSSASSSCPNPCIHAAH